METEIGNPIEYNPSIPDKSDDEPIHEEEHPPSYYMDYPHPPPVQSHSKGFDLFEKVDKSTWIIAFAVFLLGFFMGKTMQPVILRYT